MQTTRLSSKGQVIIPKLLRKRHHWLPGTLFVIEETADGIILKSEKPFPETSISELRGCVGYEGPAKSIEEIQQGIENEIMRRWHRKLR